MYGKDEKKNWTNKWIKNKQDFSSPNATLFSETDKCCQCFSELTIKLY